MNRIIAFSAIWFMFFMSLKSATVNKATIEKFISCSYDASLTPEEHKNLCDQTTACYHKSKPVRQLSHSELLKYLEHLYFNGYYGKCLRSACMLVLQTNPSKRCREQFPNTTPI